MDATSSKDRAKPDDELAAAAVDSELSDGDNDAAAVDTLAVSASLAPACRRCLSSGSASRLRSVRTP